MLTIKLVNDGNERLSIKEYSLQFPYSNAAYNDPPTYWNLNSFYCENVQNSFRLEYSYKIDLKLLTGKRKTTTTAGIKLEIGQLDGNLELDGDPKSKQSILFTRQTLFYIDEKNSQFALHNNKKRLPHFLLIDKETAVETLQFFITYEREGIQHRTGEEINFTLNLFSQNE